MFAVDVWLARDILPSTKTNVRDKLQPEETVLKFGDELFE